MANARVLNARVGRVMPNPLFGTLVDLSAAAPRQQPADRPAWRARPAQVPRVAWLLGLLLAALWPHGIWMARRLTDGSDEPWGLLALATVLALVVRARGELVTPARAALVASGALAVLAALATFVVPPIFAAGAAMLSLAAFITSALPRRPAAPMAALLLLSLPVIASLQFYLGYPLRLATAHAAAPLLALAGVDAQAAGAALLWQGRTILVDPPCAGIGMLWVGSWAAALLSYLNDASARRTLANGCVAAVAVFAANVLRNALLFFPEAGLVPAPDWLHAAIGLAAFTAALLPILAFASRAPFALRAVTSTASRMAARRAEAHAMNVLIFFVGACLAAAVLPLADALPAVSGAAGSDPVTAVGARSSAIEWPTHFRGRPLTQLPPTALEARFAARFPGAVARFTDGEQLLIVRHVRRATRLLHPASDCFRAAGYAVADARAAVDPEGVRWRCFVASRGAERLRVCERIGERFDDAGEAGWTDVSAWFWDAQWRRASSAWWALTVVTPLDPEFDS